MIYALIAVAILFGGSGFYAGLEWESGRWAKADAARQKAEAAVDAQAIKAETEAANKIGDMEAAYEAGQAKAKTVYIKVQQRGAADVTNYPVFSNRACDWPSASVLLINSAFANIRSPTDTAVAPPAVPDSTAATGRAAGSSLPVGTQPAGAVVPLRDDARPASGSGQVSGTSTGRPPKPTPRAK